MSNLNPIAYDKSHCTPVRINDTDPQKKVTCKKLQLLAGRGLKRKRISN